MSWLRNEVDLGGQEFKNFSENQNFQKIVESKLLIKC